MSHELTFWQVDAFADRLFKGNPAAVFVGDQPLVDQLMQDIAVEMNLSETAFVLERPGRNPLLRWFTPVAEIDLCGHATLSTAHIYLNHIRPEAKEVTFDTIFAGSLNVKQDLKKYTMNFPSRPGAKLDVGNIPSFVLEALSKERPRHAFKARDLMLVYDEPQVVRDMCPDFNALKKYKDFLIVTAPSDDPRYDFISRFFCADDWIAEDPVTGSAHCTLAPYWAGRLGKTDLCAYQASKRGGELFLKMDSDRVLITGEAVTVITGKMTV